MCYDAVMLQQKPNFVIIQYCNNHFSKIFATFINDLTKSYGIRKFFKEAMAYGPVWSSASSGGHAWLIFLKANIALKRLMMPMRK